VLKQVLGAEDGEVSSIDGGDLAGTLLPLVMRKMGRDRQGVLATLVMMGLQRVVVDDGRLHASMDMRVDARSVSEQNTQERSDWRVNAGASGSFGIGAWGRARTSTHRSARCRATNSSRKRSSRATPACARAST
jgi:hypothetical protein